VPGLEREKGHCAWEMVAQQGGDLRGQRQRRDDRSWQRWKERLGRGAVDASCWKDPCPFKRTGQFWALAREEALWGLDTFWRNERWPPLFPRSRPARGSKN
jgi:hypothetical protein